MATRELPIRALRLGLAISLFASSAWAQYGASGGYMPYTVDVPAAAAAAGAANAVGADERARCRMESHGRSGERYQCDEPPVAAPKR